jgi:hypothetical protein
MRKCSSFGLHQVQFALPSGMQILIPEWMLDDDRCHGMEIVEGPSLAISLFAVRELVEAQQWTPEQTSTVASEASSPGGAFDDPPRQGVLLWEIPHKHELPQTTQQSCRELLSHLLLAAVNTTPISVEEESDEREDPTESH